MTLEQIIAILLKRWWLVFLCFSTVGAGAYLGSKLLTPLYQSSALLQVTISSTNSNPADYNSLLASDQLVQTEAQLATSEPVLQAVASQYPGVSVIQLEHEVSASPKVNTQLFEIDVLDANPGRAADLANTVASVLIDQQRQSIAQVNSQSEQQIQKDLDATQQQIDTITAQLTTLQTGAQNPAQVAVLQARLTALQQHYSQWQGILAQLKLTDAQNSNFLRIVQPAQPAASPSQPSRLLYTSAGLLVGLLLGILLALLFEKLDTRVRTAEALTRLLGWPVLATIWRTPPKGGVLNPTGAHPNVESYRILRTNLGFSAIDKPLRSLMVISALPEEGKSLIAANLAIFMARAGKRTLLIDADLRRPVQHLQFDLPPDKMGLSNAVLAVNKLDMGDSPDTAPLLPALSPVAGRPSSYILPAEFSLDLFYHTVGMPKLRVMPSGPLPPNPPELLDSKAMQNLFTFITDSDFDTIILDSPPLLGLSDVSILASKVDGALVIIDVTRAHKGRLLHMKSLLTQANIRVVGCVVNKQRRKRSDASYSSYYRREPRKAMTSIAATGSEGGAMASSAATGGRSDEQRHRKRHSQATSPDSSALSANLSQAIEEPTMLLPAPESAEDGQTREEASRD